jgi:hypothetical protein
MLRQERGQQIGVARGDEGVPAIQRSLRQGRQCKYFAHRYIPSGDIVLGNVACRTGFTMKDDSNKRERQIGAAAKNSGKDLKQDRLKLALRENLKRRKSQARGRGDRIPAPSNVDDVLPYDGDGGEKPES